MPREYTVVAEFTRTDFIKSVNQSLESGWELARWCKESSIYANNDIRIGRIK